MDALFGRPKIKEVKPEDPQVTINKQVKDNEQSNKVRALALKQAGEARDSLRSVRGLRI